VGNGTQVREEDREVIVDFMMYEEIEHKERKLDAWSAITEYREKLKRLRSMM
jgi:hypothetical protein